MAAPSSSLLLVYYAYVLENTNVFNRATFLGGEMKAITMAYILSYVPWSHAQPSGLLLALFWATIRGAMPPDTVLIVTVFISAPAPHSVLSLRCSEAKAFLVQPNA